MASPNLIAGEAGDFPASLRRYPLTDNFSREQHAPENEPAAGKRLME